MDLRARIPLISLKTCRTGASTDESQPRETPKNGAGGSGQSFGPPLPCWTDLLESALHIPTSRKGKGFSPGTVQNSRPNMTEDPYPGPRSWGAGDGEEPAFSGGAWRRPRLAEGLFAAEGATAVHCDYFQQFPDQNRQFRPRPALFLEAPPLPLRPGRWLCGGSAPRQF